MPFAPSSNAAEEQLHYLGYLTLMAWACKPTLITVSYD